jgi:N-acetyl sugar amidotransferase
MTQANNDYRVCTRCVMDTSDPEISFDENGICNHCREFDTVTRLHWHPDAHGADLWRNEIERIKEEGKGKEYDSILGLSGGVDSSYLALKVYEAGLRPLVVHVDAGWNSELAVANIEALVKYCNFDLHTHVINWEDMRDLQLAYLRAGVANQDVPQDHAFFASLYHFAVNNGIRTIFSGGNTATEGIFPTSWHGSAMDAINLRAIHSKFGSRKLKSYPTISFFEYYFYFPFVRKMRTVRPLNFMPYEKQAAMEELERKCGWRSYGRKHGESLFTKLFQNFILPTKFGYDKRRPHLSSLVVSGQLTREEALKALEEPLYQPDELETDLNYFCKKLRISRAELDGMLAAANRHHSEFPNWARWQDLAKSAQRLMERFGRRKISVYS